MRVLWVIARGGRRGVGALWVIARAGTPAYRRPVPSPRLAIPPAVGEDKIVERCFFYRDAFPGRQMPTEPMTTGDSMGPRALRWIDMKTASALLALVLMGWVKKQSVTVPLEHAEATPCIEACERDHPQYGYFDCLEQCPGAQRAKRLCLVEHRPPTHYCADGSALTLGARMAITSGIGLFLLFAAIGALPFGDWVDGP
jgi:hypothetical protein